MNASQSRRINQPIPLPQGFPDLLNEIRSSIADVSGWLTDREMEFLALLAACPVAEGEVLELGCYHGKSTIVLAKAVSLTDHPLVITIDPMAMEMLPENLRRAGVDGNVEAHAALSTEVTNHWSRPLRLLWHDGANDFETVRDDVSSLIPHLADRAIVAMHDVLNPSGDRIQSFIEQILSSAQFGAFGFCGSIGWAQFRKDAAATSSFTKSKISAIRKLNRMVPFHSYNQSDPSGFYSILYRLLRSRIPHARVDPQVWLNDISRCAPDA